MKLQSTSQFPCQSWTIALLSLLSCGVGLAQLGVGVWLWSFTNGFSLVLGAPMRNVFIGYMIIGIFAFLICFLGVVSALLRNKTGLLVYVALLLASIACQAGVWAFIYLEQKMVSEVLEGRIQFRIEYYDYFTREFNCNLQVGVQSDSNLQACANFVNAWLWKIVWVMLGLCAVLIGLQFVLLVMSAMLHQLVREALRRRKVQVAPAAFTETNSPSPYNQQSASSTTPYNPFMTSSLSSPKQDSDKQCSSSPQKQEPKSSSPPQKQNSKSNLPSQKNSNPPPKKQISKSYPPPRKQNSNPPQNSKASKETNKETDSKQIKPSPFHLSPSYVPSAGLPSPSLLSAQTSKTLSHTDKRSRRGSDASSKSHRLELEGAKSPVLKSRIGL